jgi:hypothetical protein
MVRRNRNVRVHTVQSCGHAPALIADDQIEVVTKFLDGNAAGAAGDTYQFATRTA